MSLQLDDQPDLIPRWLGVMSLIASAQQMVGRGGIWPALAMVSADAAVEALLGMIATTSADPPGDRDSFDVLYEKARKAMAAAKVSFPPGLPQRINSSHRQRNVGLHLGSEISPGVALIGVQAARELRSLVRKNSTALSVIDDAGVIRAVGRMTNVKDIETAMNAADAALGEGRVKDAVDQAAIALDIATQRLDPRLKPEHFEPNVLKYGDSDRRLRDLKDWYDKRFEFHETWMIATAVGLHPVEYRDLKRVLGSVSWYVGGRIDVRRVEEPDPATAEAAVLTVADVLFRLTQVGAIRVRERWERTASSEDAADS